jgi:RNase H-like domain found in reverse transcriptase
LALPLYELCRKRKDGLFLWNDQAENALQALKKELTLNRILKPANPNEPFVLETDASSHAYRAVLLQKISDHWWPVGFMSGKFSQAKFNYMVLERELLLVIRALKNLAYLLEGLTYTVIVKTDHRNLKAIRELPISLDRHVWWSQYLSWFEVELKYIPGKENIMADCLSRPNDINTKGLFHGCLWPTKEALNLEATNIQQNNTNDLLTITTKEPTDE